MGSPSVPYRGRARGRTTQFFHVATPAVAVQQRCTRSDAALVLPVRAHRAFTAALLLAAASAADGRLRTLVGLPLIVAALATAAAGLRADARATRASGRLLWLGLSAVAGLGLVATGTAGSLPFEVARRMYCLCGVVAVAIVSAGSRVHRRRTMHAMMAASAALLLWTPVATPNPVIDVVTWTTTATRALLGGLHPYTVHAPDVYHGGRDFGYAVDVYPYMPATLLVFAPFVAGTGDFRFALAAALAVSYWLLRRAGRRLGADPRITDAAALVLVLHPHVFLIVRSGWTEPLLVGLAAAALYLSAGSPRGASWGAALCVVPLVKQYALAPAILYARADGRRAARAIAIAIAVAAVTILPFAIWNFRATLHGIVFQVSAPTHPRLTALSLPGALAASGLPFPPLWVSGVTELAVCGILSVAAPPRDLAGILMGAAVALLATFLVGWQAFVNYYYFIGSLLIMAAVAATADPKPETT